MATLYPQIICEISFATRPLETPVWVDVSSRLRLDRAAITVQYGRQHEREEVKTGTCTVPLDNRDRAFDPTNASSPYYAGLKPRRQLRLRAVWNGVTYPLFRGYIQGWPLESVAGTRNDAVVQLRANDAFLVLDTEATGTLRGGNPRTTVTTQGTVGIAEVQVLDLGGPRAGSFRLTLSSQTTAALAWNASAAAVQAALNALATIGASVVVTGANGGPYTVSWGAVGDRATILIDVTFASQLSSSMLAAALDAVGWPVADRQIETGNSTLTPLDPTGKTVVQVVQQIARSESGLVFIGPDGAVVFQNRHHRVVQGAAVAVFGDAADGIELPYSDLRLDFDEQQIFNRIVVQPVGGFSQVAEDTDSQDEYGAQTLTKSEMLITDSEGADASKFLLRRYKSPALRAPALELRGVLEGARLWPAMLGRAVGDRITVRKTPPGGGARIARDVYVESVRHQITGSDKNQRVKDWATTWQLSPTQVDNFWLFDSPTNAQFDSTLIFSY